MKYDISEPVSPKIPILGKGTECVKLLLSQVSKDMYEPMIPMFFPILGAHVSGTEFQYPDLSWKETCGMMANLVADSGGNKGQLSHIVEAICMDFRQHDVADAVPLCRRNNGKNARQYGRKISLIIPKKMPFFLRSKNLFRIFANVKR